MQTAIISLALFLALPALLGWAASLIARALREGKSHADVSG